MKLSSLENLSPFSDMWINSDFSFNKGQAGVTENFVISLGAGQNASHSCLSDEFIAVSFECPTTLSSPLKIQFGSPQRTVIDTSYPQTFGYTTFIRNNMFYGGRGEAIFITNTGRLGVTCKFYIQVLRLST